jgi:hypothetical protein
MSDMAWQSRVLKDRPKSLFCSYVYFERPEHKNEFVHQNAGDVTDEVFLTMFDLSGNPVPGLDPKRFELKPGESIQFEASDALRALGYERFQGSVLCVVYPMAETMQNLTQKDFVCLWSALPRPHLCHIGLGALTELNITPKKHRQSYLMFCPVTLSAQRKSVVAFFNHSSEAGYADTVVIRPVLENLSGKKLQGPELTVGPFGTCHIDLELAFGSEGQALLAETAGHGVLTVRHLGHTFATVFFQLDRVTGDIVNGTHTMPPIAAVSAYGIVHYWFNALAERWTILYPVWLVKNFRQTSFMPTFYPHRPLFVSTWGEFVRQSRWYLYGKYMLRAAWLLLVRKGKFDMISVTEETKHNAPVIEHNLREHLNVFQFSRRRIEQLIYPLKLIPAKLDGKTLSIGPRNEGEILLFRALGFKDVIGIDLFTYSPDILLMDAHKMDFPDDTFDTICAGWVFKYCYDLKKIVSEITRVSKDGANIACSFTIPKPEDQNECTGSRLDEGIDEILAAFGDAVGHVYWRDDNPAKMVPGLKMHLVFQIKKPKPNAR